MNGLIYVAASLGLAGIAGLVSSQRIDASATETRQGCSQCQSCFTWPWQNDEHKTTGTSGDKLGPAQGCHAGDCSVHVGCNPQFGSVEYRLLSPDQVRTLSAMFEDELVGAARSGEAAAVDFARRNPLRVTWNADRHALQVAGCDPGSIVAHVPVLGASSMSDEN